MKQADSVLSRRSLSALSVCFMVKGTPALGFDQRTRERTGGLSHRLPLHPADDIVHVRLTASLP